MHYIYFGTSEFAATILEKLLDANMTPITVVTQPDRPAGRGKKIQESPVKKIAQNGAVPVLQPEKTRNSKLEIQNLQPDLFVVAAYGEIIPKEILDIPKDGCINVHPSLLPLYRGPSPIQTAILNGETKTGVSLILLDEAIDHGPILAQETASIGYRDTSETLSHTLALQSATMLLETIPKWLAGDLAPTPQDHAKATFTKMITKEDGRIDWKKSAQEIERHVRAMTPWPGSYTFWKEGVEKTPTPGKARVGVPTVSVGKQVRVHLRRVSVLKEKATEAPGEVLDTPNDELSVVCGKDILVIHELQPEGKHVMPGSAFINGHRSIIGSVLS